ncbi:Uncharacterised protein [Mycobacteroides abscessus subsp. abscessus]|nr:Uncharacterised protein [Mycobacteroides abscessus subsp. abscessus]
MNICTTSWSAAQVTDCVGCDEVDEVLVTVPEGAVTPDTANPKARHQLPPVAVTDTVFAPAEAIAAALR